MRYRYTIHHNKFNKKYIRDEDSIEYDSALSVKAKIYDEIDSDLVDELNTLNDVIEKQTMEIKRLEQENRVLKADATITQAVKQVGNYINELLES